MNIHRLTSWKETLRLSSVLVALLSAVFVPATFGQDSGSDENLEELEGFVVTGSLIRRTDLEGPAPVLSISREDIETAGFQQISDLIRTLPMNTGTTEADATASFAADGAYANLRGVGPQGTLVLVNGRRLAPYGAANSFGQSFVDLNSFPAGAIERIEVPKTRASAIYGSDALGGAINVILRKDYEGLEIAGRYGDTTRRGDFTTQSLSATVGVSSAKGSLIAIASYFEREPMYMVDRDTTRYGNFGEPFDLSATLAEDGYFDFRKVSTGYGSTHPGAPLNMSSAAYPGRFDTVASNPAKGNTYIGGYLFPGDGTQAAVDKWEYANYNDFITLYTGANRKGLVLIGDYEATDSVNFFMEANYQTNYAFSQFAPAPAFSEWTVPANNPYNPTNPHNTAYYKPEIFTRVGLDPATYPDGAELRINAIRPTDGGLRLFQTHSDFYRFVTGVTMDVEDTGWQVEPSFMFVESKLEDITRNLIVRDLYQDALENTLTSADTGDPSLWAINPFVNGPGQSDNDYIYNELVTTDDTRLSSSKLSLWEVRANGPLFDLPAGAVMMAVGAEYREENLEDRPSLASSQGQLIGSGGASSDGTRTAKAYYAEVNVPVLDFVELQGAIRYEEYNDFGDTGLKPQVGVKVEIIDSLSVRAAFSDNFKAPSLSQSYAGLQRGFLALEDPIRYPITGDQYDSRDQQKESRTGGNPILQPEESESISVGIIFSGKGPLEGLEVSVDYWRIDASNLITTQSDGDILATELAAYNADKSAFLALSPTERLNRYNVFREPNSTFQGQTIPGQIAYINSVYVNLDTLYTDGVDFDIRYTLKTDKLGTFQFGTTWTWLHDYDDGFDRVGGFRFPEWRGNTSVIWSYGDFDVAGLMYYIHGTEDQYTAGYGDPRLNEYITYDLRVTYSGLWDTEFTVGVDNVFDFDPPVSWNSGGRMVDFATADLIGRFVWFGFKKAF